MARPIRRRPRTAVISKNRAAWADTVLGSFVFLRIPESERHESEYDHIYAPEAGDTILLQVPGKGDSYVSLDLTKLTDLELDYVESVISQAIACARPIVQRRDTDAENARIAGQDHFNRIYRALPQFFVREGAQPEYDSGVQQGREGVS